MSPTMSDHPIEKKRNRKTRPPVRQFWRVWKYVWPQWFRLAWVVITALFVGMLFSVSFMAIIPLLKVMMGEEGLHGWIDRKCCDLRYGMDFYVPNRSDFMGVNAEIAYYLLVTGVEEEERAYANGFRPQDRILDVAHYAREKGLEKVPASRLLELLATAEDGVSLPVRILRPNASGIQEPREIVLHTLKHPDNISPEEMPLSSRLEWGFKWAIVHWAQKAISVVSREESRTARSQSVVFIILVMAFITSFRCIGTFVQKYLSERVVQTAITHLRDDVFAHVMFMPIGFFSVKGTSDTISRILGDTAASGKGIKILLGKALLEPIKAFFCLVGAMLINWQLALIFMAAAPVTIALLGLLGKKMRRATKRSLIASAMMLGRLQDSISALRVVKVYNRQNTEVVSFSGVNRQLLRRAIHIAKLDAATGPIMEFLGMVAGSAALLVGVHWVMQNDMEGSFFFALLVLLGTSAESVRKVSDVWNRVQEANAAADRVFEIVDNPLEHEDPEAFELKPLHEEVEFRDITFSYPGADTTALNDVSLKVQAGQTIAVVGPNGSGKTTLINLIPRFYDPDAGQVFIDGQDIHMATLRSLRAQIGMVTQNVVTFHESVAANIGYGKEGATREEIIAAAQKAHAHEFIERLPDGYDTVIGEHGSGFSGGQLQRLVIARAVVKNPAILIFDEAMSQIDADSEAKINEALSELMEGRTCFIIAHRFSTVVHADSIVVMDKGGIVAQGRHGELMESCSVYRSLYETQLITADE
ncbi:MAG: ABC transporter ATP-binding protein [Sedimentisphaerales bacterium]|nr:ABC transporter ATP-binding protein [Sedimentisphaerales bacterium]